MPESPSPSSVPLRLLPCGSAALLVELPDLAATVALNRALVQKEIPGVTEIVPGARTLLLRFDRFRTDGEALAAAIAQCRLLPDTSGERRIVEIPLRYDGEDLAEVAALTGLSEAEVIARHSGTLWTVAFGGFAPGFAYLSGGDPALEVPRRASPRPRIAPGSVALAGPFSGVYPQASPGGWQIIGTTPLAMWDLSRETPALLSPGDQVRFVNTPEAQIRPSTPAKTTADAPDQGAPGLVVEETTFPILLQDEGRPGRAGQGVPASGAMDRAALRSLNRILGNPAGTPALEIAGGTASLRVDHCATVAVTGAGRRITVNGSISVPTGRPFALNPGDRLSLGAPEEGLRSLLGLRGGFSAPSVLGSLSSDSLCGLGPDPLTKGARITAAQARCAPLGDAEPQPSLPRAGNLYAIDVHLGPRTDWFTDESLALLESQPWEITPQSNRVGLRLRAPQPLAQKRPRELPSEGVARGAIQVPHNGQPVLFLADHPLTGGYPVIAVVAEHHLDRVAQAPAGARLTFRPLAPFGALATFNISGSQ